MNVCIMPRPRGIIYNNCIIDNTDTVSKSMLNAVNDMQQKIDVNNEELVEICKIVNTYEYVFSNVSEKEPFAIGKMNPSSNFYYEIREILNSFGLLKISRALCIGDSDIKSLFTDSATYDLYNIIIIDQTTTPIALNNSILSSLAIGATLIIKLSNITNKETIHFLYLLSILFEKAYIVKPSVVNIMSSDVFIVCVSFLNDGAGYASNLDLAEIPNFFLSKIEEFNSINGHRQLDAYDQVFNMLYNKNRWQKLELLKKLNIQKSIAWCDKNNVPCNKIGDKTNMFLNNY